MTSKLFPAFFLFLFIACNNPSVEKSNRRSAVPDATPTISIPNFGYSITVPPGWTTLDTLMQDGLRVRMLLSPKSLKADYPAGNIVIAGLDGKSIDEFMAININYLEENMPGITIQERGNIKVSNHDARWFTYIKEQDGTTREMINYIIPFEGFAYMITCGANKGSFGKYKKAFDSIAQSFKG